MTHRGLYLFAMLACNLVLERRVDADGNWHETYRLPYADPGIDGPGTECPWPFDPWQLYGAPLGQYHCPYCGSMVLAGMEHLDYADDSDLDTGD